MDVLSEEDVMSLHQAIAHRRASRLAKAVYAIGNVMSCLKTLMLEHNEQQRLVVEDNLLSSTDVKLEDETLAVPDNQTTKDADHCFENDSKLIESEETGADDEIISLKDEETAPESNPVITSDTPSPIQNGRKKSGERKTLSKRSESSTEAMFTCEKCGYQTRRKDHFKRHSASHAEVKPVRCSLCTFSCIDKYHLIRHLNSSVHSNKKRQEELKCESCDYKTNYANRMLRHVRTHSGEKPFACTFCSYKAAQKATLERHILTHTGEKPYKCDKCDYCAADTKSLRFHTLQKHAADEGTVHKCPHCEYSTPVSRYFKLHMRAHSDARPYLCDICGYSSKRPHGLTKHYRAVHGWSKSDTDGKQWRRCPADTRMTTPHLSTDTEGQCHEELNKQEEVGLQYTGGFTNPAQGEVVNPQLQHTELSTQTDRQCNRLMLPSTSYALPTSVTGSADVCEAALPSTSYVLPTSVTGSADVCEAAFFTCNEERESEPAADSYLGAVLSEMSESAMSADSGNHLRAERFF